MRSDTDRQPIAKLPIGLVVSTGVTKARKIAHFIMLKTVLCQNAVSRCIHLGLVALIHRRENTAVFTPPNRRAFFIS